VTGRVGVNVPGNAHVLIVEDNDMSFVLADCLLQPAGYVTQRAADGDSAIRLASESQPDLILCDLDLPGMDGYQLVEALRALPGCRAIPILAFTADSPQNDVSRLQTAGFTDWLRKPPDPRTFSATVARYLRPQASAS
jgi:CheY-like chemotaxis protein